jgi:hypothetical protein
MSLLVFCKMQTHIRQIESHCRDKSNSSSVGLQTAQNIGRCLSKSEGTFTAVAKKRCFILLIHIIDYPCNVNVLSRPPKRMVE